MLLPDTVDIIQVRRSSFWMQSNKQVKNLKQWLDFNSTEIKLNLEYLDFEISTMKSWWMMLKQKEFMEINSWELY